MRVIVIDDERRLVEAVVSYLAEAHIDAEDFHLRPLMVAPRTSTRTAQARS